MGDILAHESELLGLVREVRMLYYRESLRKLVKLAFTMWQFL